MAILSLGGIHWDPHFAGWGKVGRPAEGAGSSKEMLGYSAKKGAKGKLSEEERSRRTVDVWSCHAVYALFERGRCIYIGEGKLGDRIEKHWKTDTLIGRWDSFTWLSPWDYQLPEQGNATVTAKADNYQEAIGAKQLVELLELVAIRLGSPEANAQMPKNESAILWLTQIRSKNALSTVEEKLDEALTLLKGLQQQGQQGG
jgi:hypothetical protein